MPNHFLVVKSQNCIKDSAITYILHKQYLRTRIKIEKSDMMRTQIQHFSTRCKKPFGSSLSDGATIRSLNIKNSKKATLFRF